MSILQSGPSIACATDYPVEMCAVRPSIQRVYLRLHTEPGIAIAV